MPGLLTSTSLTATDRCDSCGAAARMRATLVSGGELLFCQHHGNEHVDKLVAQGATIESSPVED